MSVTRYMLHVPSEVDIITICIVTMEIGAYNHAKDRDHNDNNSAS